MKRRKFLQILGLTAAAPAAVLVCPPVTKIGIDFGMNPDKTVYWEGNNNNWIEHEFPAGNEMTVKHINFHEYAFPNKPIYPNYMTTNG